MFYLGIDPGQSGGVTLLDCSGHIVDSFPFTKKTDHDISEWFEEMTSEIECICYIERVGSRPGQGVASSFKFGDNNGFLRGLITAYKIPYVKVTPGKWQKYLGCLSKGDKNVTKAKAQQLYPEKKKITHAIADSILIARYCYEIESRK